MLSYMNKNLPMFALGHKFKIKLTNIDTSWEEATSDNGIFSRED